MQRKTGALVIAAIAVCVFWRTAYPTIAWWDSASYSLAAGTLGITGPPGSLLLTLLGWPIAHLPFGSSPAYLLNLFAGVLAAVAAVFVAVVASRVLQVSPVVSHITGAANGGATHDAPLVAASRGSQRPNVFEFNSVTFAGVAIGALTFAFSSAMWKYGTQFTPYVLTVVFTGAILHTLVRWWENANNTNSWKWLALLGLLFGLDYSVHRTNAILLPAALLWILMRNPRVLTQKRSLLGGGAALVVGLAVQFLVIPISLYTRSEHNFFTPNTLSRFWDYESLRHLGGNFLLGIFPRRSPLWSVQFGDLFAVVRNSYWQIAGLPSVLTALPAVAAIIGVGALFVRNRRFALALVLLLVSQVVVTVMYFNIPENFFRSFDRHYLPVCFTIGVFVACGLGVAANGLAKAMRSAPRALAYGVVSLLAIVPAVQLLGNWKTLDASDRYFARDFAVNSLNALPQNAIHLTVGDNDTFPLMYMQAMEGVRRDVRVVNTSVLHMDMYPERVLQLEPSFPLSLNTQQRKAMLDKVWTDTLVAIPVTGTGDALGMGLNAHVPATVEFEVKPAPGTKFYPGDVSFFDIVRTNQFRRPITISTTAGDWGKAWLAPFARMEGLYWRIVPQQKPAANINALRANLMKNYSYRGYDNLRTVIDDPTRNIGALYYDALVELAKAESVAGEKARCVADVREFVRRFPPARTNSTDSTGKAAESACGAGGP